MLGAGLFLDNKETDLELTDKYQCDMSQGRWALISDILATMFIISKVSYKVYGNKSNGY